MHLQYPHIFKTGQLTSIKSISPGDDELCSSVMTVLPFDNDLRTAIELWQDPNSRLTVTVLGEMILS